MTKQSKIFENGGSHSRALIENVFDIICKNQRSGNCTNLKYSSKFFNILSSLLFRNKEKNPQNENFFNIRESYKLWKRTNKVTFDEHILSKLDEAYEVFYDPISRKTFDWYIQFKIAWVLTGDVDKAEKIFPYPTPGRLHFKKLEARNMVASADSLNINGYSFNTDNIMLFETWIAKGYMLEDKCEPEQGDIAIDAGAYQGETAIWLADRVGKDGKVFGFEIIQSNIDIFKKNIERNSLDNVFVIEYGLWDENTSIWTEADSYRSKCIVGKSDNRIDAVTLDSFVAERGLERVDFIKMDIEGAEMRGLHGAKNTIKNYKPKLAICVYHLDMDIIEIPLFIKELVPEYKIYLSHKIPYYNSTVVFAAI